MRTIVFIAGSGRSGSTILGKLLDQGDTTTHIGEIRYFAQIGYRENRECECGEKLRSCPFWGPIISQMSQQFDLLKISEISKGLQRNLNLYISDITSSKVFIPSIYIEFIDSLYSLIFEKTKSKYIIDSTKFPIHLESLYRTDSFDMRVIHLTRDPRSVANSWSKKKQTNEGPSSNFIGTRLPWKVALSWRMCNVVTSQYRAKVPFFSHNRWEDITTYPSQSVGQIIHELDLELSAPQFSRDNDVNLKSGHAFWGNSSRRLHGTTKILRDAGLQEDIYILYRYLIFFLSGAYKFNYKVWN
jgi:hypothetical protein